MNRLEDMDITYLTGVGPKRAELLKKELGIGYNDYLNMLRIDMAGRLLENESIGLQKISELCGFSDITYFCRKFKQKTLDFCGN